MLSPSSWADSHGGWVHAYVMSNDEYDIRKAHERMYYGAGYRVLMPDNATLRRTTLDDTSTPVVQEIVAKYPERLWEKDKGTFVIWPTVDSDPDQQRLLGLHV
jgi:hypothetical protein